MNKNQIYNKLAKCKGDLSDDNMDIYTMNLGVDNLITNFEYSVKSDNTGDITAKIASLKEGSQQSDANISRAASYVQNEMDCVQKEIGQEEAATKAAAAALIKAIKTSIMGD